MKIINGNILSNIDNNTLTIILQAVNCKGVMGAGLAKQIRNKYPEIYHKYKQLCISNAPTTLLGNINQYKVSSTLYIFNCFTQNCYGTTTQQTSYDAVKNCFTKINNLKVPATIRIPYKMCCGLAGGDWNIVSAIINSTLTNPNLNIECWKLN